ncbi:MAG: hypothetical protein HYW77_00345 [Parcubacteria group bacterium]|nr:hypothetical protein [Parcubacteria group bacterium]
MVSAIIKNRPYSLEIESSLNNVQGQFKKLEDQQKNLDKLVDYFKSISFQEKEARIKYNLKKPGEEVFIIKKEGSEELDQSAEVKNSFWGSIKNWFSKIF